MTVATVASRALAGIDAPEVTVEVHLGPGLPSFHIVGLPDAHVREARDRVRAALNHTHFEVVGHLTDEARLAQYSSTTAVVRPAYPDFSDVKGQQHVKRALEVAAAGGHSVLMIGPPGTGKSMLAARFPGILPPLSEDESLEVAAVHSVSTNGFQAMRWGERPFRSPHHSASAAAMVGGGNLPRPGEISLAHHGVLFLDELPEFDRDVLEALREPIETGRVAISRAARQVQFPARFQLVAAMNPCPCGHCGDRTGRCRCTPERIARYRGRISGPLADRIDIKLEVPALREAELVAPVAGEPSAVIRNRVEKARQLQMQRQGKPNALLGTKEIDRHCATDREGDQLLRHALARLLLSARGYHRVLRVSRTVADLSQKASVTAEHIAEAIQYRRLDASF